MTDKEYREQINVGEDESTPPEKTSADLAASEKDEIPRTPAGPLGDLYAVPVRRRQPKSYQPADPSPSADYVSLPPGWEKHEGDYQILIYYGLHMIKFTICYFIFSDNDGPYYWHIKSGTIQREAPTVVSGEYDGELGSEVPNDGVMTSSVIRSTTSSALDIECDDRKRREELAFKFDFYNRICLKIKQLIYIMLQSL